MFSSRFLTQAADRSPINATLTHRSKLFTRRAVVRYPHVVPTQPPSDMTADTVAPETAVALAVVDGTTATCIQPSVDDLVVAAAEPDTEFWTDEALAPAHLADVLGMTEPCPVSVEGSVAPSSTSVPPTKVKKTARKPRKRKNEASGSARPKLSPRKKRSLEGSGVRSAAEVDAEVENFGLDS